MAVHFQAKAHVIAHSHMRIKRISLEHHRHAAQAWVHRGYVSVTDVHRATCRFLEPSHHAQQSRFTAA